MTLYYLGYYCKALISCMNDKGVRIQSFIEGTHLNKNASQRLGELNNIGRRVSRVSLPGSPTVHRQTPVDPGTARAAGAGK